MPAFKTMNPFELSHTINTLGEGSKGFIVLLYQIYETDITHSTLLFDRTDTKS